MSDPPTPPTDPADRVQPRPPRPRSTLWTGLALVVLMGAGLLVAQLTTYGGPPVNWIYNDLDAALREAKRTDRRLFLYLHRPGCDVTPTHDRSIFNQRFARERLQGMVACRLELASGDPRAARFRFTGQPLMLVLDPQGAELARLEGPVDQLRFETYIHASTQR